VLELVAPYDVIGSLQGIKDGTLRHKGLRFFMREPWEIHESNDGLIGVIPEEDINRVCCNACPYITASTDL
jgi:hypothetical protein